MCKNLMIVGIKPDKQKEMQDFMVAMQPKMNQGDRDGLGYAMMTEYGLWGERWFDPKDAFHYRREWSPKDQEIKDMFQGLLEADPRYNYFVENDQVPGKPAIAVIMHARAATCERALKNVHPFVYPGIAMIHNGVISNDDKFNKKVSTCDSEAILDRYVTHDIAKNPDKITEVARDLSGSYTCGVLTRNAEGVPILDIFRSSPSLYAIYIKELDALVFCTSSQFVVDTCKELKWKMGSPFKVKDDKLIRLDARTGRFLSTHGFYSSYVNRYNNSGQTYGGSRHPYLGQGGYGDWGDDDSGEFVNTKGSSCNLPVIGPTNRSDDVVGQNDPNNDDGPTLSAQEEAELARANVGEKKTSLTASATTKSPKVLEMDIIRRMTVISTDSTGKETVIKPTLH